MKIFAFIMALVVLVLTCMPCMDEATLGIGEAKNTISKTGAQHQHDDADACSPFCTCNCCAAFAFISASYQIESLIKPIIGKNAIQLPAFISEIPLPVWQPPQLS